MRLTTCIGNRLGWSAILGVMVLLLGTSGVLAAGADDFYHGRTLTITTSNGPGGGFDFYMRTTAKYIEKVAGVKVVAQNVPGAGGTLGDNKLYFSKADGLTIGLINFPGHVLAQVLGHQGVQYDFSKWEWLGRVAGVPPAIGVAPNSSYKTLDDMINSKKPVRFGLEGKGSDAYYGVIFLRNVLGIPVMPIVGYGGPGEIAAGMMAGEVDARFESIDSLLPAAKSGQLRLVALLNTERDARVPDVPTAVEVAGTDEQKGLLEALAGIYSLERSFVAPAGTPADRVAYLRDILWSAWQDPGFVADMEAAGRSLALMQGGDVETAAMKVARQADKLGKHFEE